MKHMEIIFKGEEIVWKYNWNNDLSEPKSPIVILVLCIISFIEISSPTKFPLHFILAER